MARARATVEGRFFPLSYGGSESSNGNGDNIERRTFPAAKGFVLEIFQNLVKNMARSLDTHEIYPKSSKNIEVYLEFLYTPPPKPLFLPSSDYRPHTLRLVFLFLMDGDLSKVMQAMSLEEDVPIDIPDDDDFSAIVRNGRSLIGRLLNPDCQNMARMLRTMSRIWKVYERARGIALTRETFQFIFELETDIQMVMKQGFWTFDDWGMAMDRWVEFPPPNFLQKTEVWIRLSKIPVNYFTLKTIDSGWGYRFCQGHRV